MTLIKDHSNLEVKRCSTLLFSRYVISLHEFCLPYAFSAVCVNIYTMRVLNWQNSLGEDKDGDIIAQSVYNQCHQLYLGFQSVPGPRQLEIFLDLSEGEASQISHLFHHCDNISLESHQTRSIK